ncbi:MAG TPA: aldehyde-activating protein [Gammaproteobacteria bacterium]|nr:aldehyde-activating protein [Gammaproteobacteria bacterium]
MAETCLSGGCLCGSVRFTVHGPLREVLFCHCSQCRKMSGHFWAATSTYRDCIDIRQDDSLRWFQSSKEVERGFCVLCGSSLFWNHAEKNTLSIAAGAFDKPTGLDTGAHIFFDDASDYYQVHPDEKKIRGSSS